MEARVNQELCVGCGLCASMNPEVFQMDENGLATAVKETEDEAFEEEEIAAVDIESMLDAASSQPQEMEECWEEDEDA